MRVHFIFIVSCYTRNIYSRPGMVSLGSFPPSSPGLLTTNFHPPSTGRSIPFTPTFSMMYLTVGVIWSTVRGTRGKVACLSKSSVKKEEKLPVIAVTTIADDQLLSRTGKRNGLHGEIEAHLIPDGPKKSANAVKSADVSVSRQKDLHLVIPMVAVLVGPYARQRA